MEGDAGPHIQETESGSQSLSFKHLKSCPEYEVNLEFKARLFFFAFYNYVILSRIENRVMIGMIYKTRNKGLLNKFYFFSYI